MWKHVISQRVLNRYKKNRNSPHFPSTLPYAWRWAVFCTRACLYNAVNFLSCPSAQPCVWCITGPLFSQFKEALRANLSVDHPTFCSSFPQCSVVYDSLQLHDCSPPGSSVRGIFSREEYWNGLPFLTPGDLPNPEIEPAAPALVGRFLIEPYHLGSPSSLNWYRIIY